MKPDFTQLSVADDPTRPLINEVTLGDFEKDKGFTFPEIFRDYLIRNNGLAFKAGRYYSDDKSFYADICEFKRFYKGEMTSGKLEYDLGFQVYFNLQESSYLPLCLNRHGHGFHLGLEGASRGRVLYHRYGTDVAEKFYDRPPLPGKREAGYFLTHSSFERFLDVNREYC